MIGKKQVAVIGASGAIGTAFINQLLRDDGVDAVYAFSRSDYIHDDSRVKCGYIDIVDEASVKTAAQSVPAGVSLDMVFVATGMLHTPEFGPEKSLKDLSFDKFQQVFTVNTIGPALVAKYFIAKMQAKQPAVFAAISARVGSIEDNYLGGWYSYRASKAALNMVLKNISIEVARKYPEMVVAGLHPGTVESSLSDPFKHNVQAGKLFTPEYSAECLLKVIDGLSASDTGKVFAYDGSVIEY